MIKITFPKVRFAAISILLLALLSLTNSCKKSSSGPGKDEIYIEKMAFSPATKTVALNTTVTWINKDGVSHTVTSTSGLFDSGAIADNGTFSYTFTSAGTFSYKCSIHPTMTGTIIVNPDQSTSNYGY
jgi:plastocyanin